MSVLLYALTAVLLLFLAHRFVLPISRVAALLLVLLPFAFTGYALLTDRVYGPINLTYSFEPLKPLRERYGITIKGNGLLGDVASQIIPWRAAVRWALARGEWPIYNPFILSGDNLAGSAQPAAYSPFTLIACLLPVAKSLTYTAAIAFFVAALGAFLFARDLGCGELGALVAAAAFMFSAPMTFFILWPLGFSWAFLPVVMLGVRRVCVTGGSIRAVAFLTAGFVLLLLAGHPETAAHVVLIGIAYSIFEMLRNRHVALRAAAGGIAAGLVALAISAVYLLPVLEVAPQTADYFYRVHGFANTPRGVTSAEIVARLGMDVFPFLHLRDWLTPLVPPWQPVDSPILGSIALVLAMYAMWRARFAHTWFFAGLALFGMLAHAGWGPLLRALQKVPLLDITFNERLSFGAAFALAILAGFAADQILDRRFALLSGVLLVILSIGTAIILRAGILGPPHSLWHKLDVAADLGALAILTAIALAPVRARTVVIAALALIVLQRAAEERGFYAVIRASSAYPPIRAFQPLESVRDPFRVTGVGLTFIPNMSTLYGLEDVRGYQALTHHGYVATYDLWCINQPIWFNRVDDLTRPFLSFLNVRYAVALPSFEPPRGWRVVAEADGTRLLENSNALPRAFVPRWTRIGESDEAARAQMAAAPDFAERAWIALPNAPDDRVNGPGVVKTRRTAHGYELDAEMAGDGWIVISETAWDGWRASVDGKKARVSTANTAFLSVYVPSGRHRVVLEYRPRSFVAGRAITLLTLLLIALAASGHRFAQRVRRNAGRLEVAEQRQ